MVIFGVSSPIPSPVYEDFDVPLVFQTPSPSKNAEKPSPTTNSKPTPNTSKPSETTTKPRKTIEMENAPNNVDSVSPLKQNNPNTNSYIPTLHKKDNSNPDVNNNNMIVNSSSSTNETKKNETSSFAHNSPYSSYFNTTTTTKNLVYSQIHSTSLLATLANESSPLYPLLPSAPPFSYEHEVSETPKPLKRKISSESESNFQVSERSAFKKISVIPTTPNTPSTHQLTTIISNNIDKNNNNNNNNNESKLMLSLPTDNNRRVIVFYQKPTNCIGLIPYEPSKFTIQDLRKEIIRDLLQSSPYQGELLIKKRGLIPLLASQNKRLLSEFVDNDDWVLVDWNVRVESVCNIL